MYVLEGMTHKEIAESLGCSLGTSKSQLSKARKYLKKKLEERKLILEKV
jgi:RNA polymerase sigma-70 factor (ECF subfamily)